MKVSRKTYAAAVLAFCLSSALCLYFMTADFYMEEEILYTAVNGFENQGELPAIVLDAGHGGFDGGAQAADGTMEKDINLAIVKKLADLADEYRVEVILTRDGDYGLYKETSQSKKQEDLQKRKTIMEQSGAAAAVSIHLNSYPQDTSVYGAQVFYSPDSLAGEQDMDERIDICELAEHVQQTLEEYIDDGRTRTAMKKNDILLLKDPSCPLILVECGFLSNPEEAERLKTAEYQQLLAEAVWKGINDVLCLEKRTVLPVIDSTNKIS